MAIVVGDILQITDVQTYLSQVCLNVYFYRVTLAQAQVEYDDVRSCFQSDMQASVLGFQADAVQHYQVAIRNLTNGIDVVEFATNSYGGNAGEGMPSFVAYGFRLYRTNASTRHGQKRFVGCMEAHIQNNAPVAGILATLTACATALKSKITYPGGATDQFEAEPVIVGRFPESHPDHGKLDLATINPVANATFVRVTSQTTRRVGRGN